MWIKVRDSDRTRTEALALAQTTYGGRDDELTIPIRWEVWCLMKGWLALTRFWVYYFHFLDEVSIPMHTCCNSPSPILSCFLHWPGNCEVLHAWISTNSFFVAYMLSQVLLLAHRSISRLHSSWSERRACAWSCSDFTRLDDSVALAVLNLRLDKCPDSEDACRLRINDWPLLHKVAGQNIWRAAEICRLRIRAFPDHVLEHALINRVKHLLHRSCPSASMPFSKWNKLLQISSLSRVETQ